MKAGGFGREAALAALVLAVLLALPQVSSSQMLVDYGIRLAAFGIFATSLNILVGYGGMVSFGHAAYFGVGGYVAGILAHHAFSGVPLDFVLFQLPGTNLMPVIWVVAIILSGLLALFIGAVSIRTSGVYFIMITLAFAQMTYYFANSWPAYGGEDGLSILVRNQFPGVNTLRPLSYFFICYAILIAVLILFAVIRDSRFGAALQAARQNEVRVATVGIDAYRIRLVAFVISGMITGLAGALYADLNRFVSPSMLSWHMSGEFIVLIILGGVARLYGPVAGAMLFVMFEFLLGGLTDRWQFFLGLVLLGVVLLARGGLVGWLAGRARHG